MAGRLRGATDWRLHGPATSDGDARVSRRIHAPAGYGDGENTPTDGFARGLSGVREPEDEGRRQRELISPDVSRGHESCPLIYTVDAATAKKHGLLLFQVMM